MRKVLLRPSVWRAGDNFRAEAGSQEDADNNVQRAVLTLFRCTPRGGPARRGELDLMILMGPFQCEISYDSILQC